jgi:methionine--tRNA ligase beta chain
MENVDYAHFAKLDIRVGVVEGAENLEGSEKLVKMIVDFGEEVGERQVLAGLQKDYIAADLVGIKTLFLVNLEPKKMAGSESQGMLLMADANDKPVFVKPDEPCELGDKIC